MYGYMGKMLFVNLSTGEIEERELTEQLARNFIGGPALGAKILYDEMPAKADVFGPESMVGFVSGPLNGTRAFFGGRYTVVSKSPVYGGLNDCNSGGFFGPMLKKAGFDAVFVKGLSKSPVYIFVDNGKVELRDAAHLWGKTIKETEAELSRELGASKFNAAIIGPSGEKLSYMAAVMNDAHRAAARGGSGAVMGSKMLKALVVCGDQKTPVFDSDKVVEVNKELTNTMKNGPMAGFLEGFGTYGTGRGFVAACLKGDAGVKNLTSAAVADYPEEASGALATITYDAEYKIKKYSCSNCPLGCGAIYDVKDGKWPLEHIARPEYETFAAFGSMLLNSDHESLFMCNDICNEYGLDTLSAGGTVAWAMDCYNRGVLSRDDLDGIDLAWGNSEAIVALMEKIARGEGCGGKLINGSRAAAEAYGKGFECLAVASGMEVGQHDARLAPGLTRIYQYDAAPGRHTKGGYGIGRPLAPPYKGTGFQDMLGIVEMEMVNASGMCLFQNLTAMQDLCRKHINAVTGFNFSQQDFISTGLRSFNMRNAFNLREGLRRKDYTLSEVLHRSPEGMTGPLTGVDIDNEQIAENVFNVLGWDLDMVPNRAALELLGGLDNVITDLYSVPAESRA